ncbi:MAG: sensor histidine kinase [Alphaproteobacteria bacterium]|nr:sensor histidine kinase [Alphaproteobacteria bacterium]
MVTLSASAAALLAVFAGGWLAVALWATLRGRRTAVLASSQRRAIARISGLLASGPAVPLVVRRDGILEGGDRLAALLGLERLPRRFADLAGERAVFSPDDAAMLSKRLAEAARGGGASVLVLRSSASSRILRFEIAPAPSGFGSNAAVIWVIDVTDQERRADAHAAEAERQAAALQALSGLIEVAPFPIWHRGPDLRLALVNSAYVSAVEGRDATQVVQDGIELIDEAGGRNATREAAEIRDRGEPVHRIVPATIAGERRMMHIVELPVGPSGVAGFAMDVDDLEQTRAELARFVQAQRDMLDRLSAGVAQFSKDRTLIFFNQPFARLFGLGGEFLADRPEFDRVIDAMRDARKLPEPRDYPGWKAERRAWFTEGLAAIEEDWELPDRRHLRVLAQPLPDGGLLAIFEDRTRQMMLESDRERMQQVQTTTFDNLAEGIAVFASSRRLKLWNDRFLTLWGLNEADLAQRPMVEAIAAHIGKLVKRPRQAVLVRDLIRAAISTRRPRSGRLSLKDGREYELAAIPIPADDVLFTILDVTDSARVETALRDRTMALEEADRVKTAFVSNISYELRTPLTSIAGFAEMLEGGYAGTLPGTANDYVGAIITSVGRLSALIDDILDLTQSDMGSLLLAEDEIDLADLGETVAAQAREIAGAKQIEFEATIDASAGTITGDRRRLNQAMLNLLRNAIQFTPAAGRVTLTVEGKEAEAQLIVSDNGPGIPPAEQARVFDRFQSSAAQTDGGIGLGMPLARQFIEAHGGTIKMTSELGRGTTFQVTLPRTEGQRAAHRALAVPPESGAQAPA